MAYSVDSGRETKGFGVVLGDGSNEVYKLSPGEKGHGVVTWEPMNNMTVATKLHLTLKLGDKESRLEITVKGVAGTGKVSKRDKLRPQNEWNAEHAHTKRTSLQCHSHHHSPLCREEAKAKVTRKALAAIAPREAKKGQEGNEETCQSC